MIATIMADIMMNKKILIPIIISILCLFGITADAAQTPKYVVNFLLWTEDAKGTHVYSTNLDQDLGVELSFAVVKHNWSCVRTRATANIVSSDGTKLSMISGFYCTNGDVIHGTYASCSTERTDENFGNLQLTWEDNTTVAFHAVCRSKLISK